MVSLAGSIYSVDIQYCAKVLQVKCVNFVLCLCHQKIARKFEGKFNAFQAMIIHLNNRGNFIGFLTPLRKFAINNILSLVST